MSDTLYVAGLIDLGNPKSVQPMEARGDGVPYDRLPHFIAAGIWDEAPLQQVLLAEAERLVGGPDEILVVDDTALPKKSIRSVGVAPQCATALGKTANCETLGHIARRRMRQVNQERLKPPIQIVTPAAEIRHRDHR